MRPFPLAVLLTSTGTLLSACADRSPTAPAAPRSLALSARVGLGTPTVTIDFSSFGSSKFLVPDFYRLDGILFPPVQCGASGCGAWFVQVIQGDDALVGGPVNATFARPISELSVRVAPALQGTAVYVLNAFAGSGTLLGATSVTVTQDEGDPDNSGFGYFTLSLTNLPGPAASFTLDNVFVRSSFPQNVVIPFGVSSITYTHWGNQP
jgi:hypothetical protein